MISGYKASLITAATSPLDDEQAAEADRRAAPKLAGKTPGQIKDLIRRIVITVDPEGAQRRREEAQREQGRVEFWQDEINGTANLAGFALPADEALIANQRIQDRALAYKKARVIPGAPMDLLRVRAYIDLLLGRDARDTIPADSTGSEPSADRPTGRRSLVDRPTDSGPASTAAAPDRGVAVGTGDQAAARPDGTSGQDEDGNGQDEDGERPTAGSPGPAGTGTAPRPAARRAGRLPAPPLAPGPAPGWRPTSTSPSPCPPCWDGRTGPGTWPGSAPSTPPWPAPWPPPPPAAPGRSGA